MGLIHVANYVVIDRNWWQTSFALYKYASQSCINSKVAMYCQLVQYHARLWYIKTFISTPGSYVLILLKRQMRYPQRFITLI